MPGMKAMSCEMDADEQVAAFAAMFQQFADCPDEAIAKWTTSTAAEVWRLFGLPVALDFLLSAWRDPDGNVELGNDDPAVMLTKMQEFLRSFAELES